MPYRNFFSLSLLFVCFIIPAGKVWAQDPFKNSVQDGKIISDVDGKRYITAIRTDVPLKIDGALNEPAWSNAQFVGQFTQREPVEGAPASEKTEVGFLYDQKNLYIGIKCYDSEAGCRAGQRGPGLQSRLGWCLVVQGKHHRCRLVCRNRYSLENTAVQRAGLFCVGSKLRADDSTEQRTCLLAVHTA